MIILVVFRAYEKGGPDSIDFGVQNFSKELGGNHGGTSFSEYANKLPGSRGSTA